MFKKRWFDGLQDIYEGKDEFEIKFGCFGGDGGDNGGAKAAEQTPEQALAESPNDGFRGEQSAAAASAASALGASQSTSGLNTSMESMSMNEALGQKAQAPATQQASFTSPTVTSIAPSMFSMAPSIANPTNPAQAKAQATSPAFSGLSIGPGTLTGTISPNSVGLNYGVSFAKGGVVHQGIGSIFPSKR